jgi:hypothetical protein
MISNPETCAFPGATSSGIIASIVVAGGGGAKLPSYGGQAGIVTELKPFIAQLRNQLEEGGRAADKGFPDNRYLRFEKGEPILTPVEALPDPKDWISPSR